MLGRRALRAIGGPEIALISGTDRAPTLARWFCRINQHTASRAAAAVARLEDFAGIGIDIEIVSQHLVAGDARITTETERPCTGVAADRQFLLALIFSAKESWFKCQFPLTGVYLILPMPKSQSTGHIALSISGDAPAPAGSTRRDGHKGVLPAATTSPPPQ